MFEKLIPKEAIGDYHIVQAEEDRSTYWKEQLNYAVRLGNEFKSKTTVTFNTSEGPKSVETTVWSLTENYISLKGGILIPLNSIIDVHF
ncbi:hypothetical protein [Niabella beijingensis]|uniref:hypothetical protein n=1 Tax=Niabella beijingensis TaxID=2872700 RepID=UPI001CBB2047|nr:hypothetical protein [Niabella beijingensis]MBZ4188593.1 hypothetical protein [Niabella beijingensis]